MAPERTRPPEPESARQTNIRTSKRQEPQDHRAPKRLNIGGGAHNLPAAGTYSAVASTIAPHLQAQRRKQELRETITLALARAIDTCMEAYKAPEETAVAADIRQCLIRALLKDSPTAAKATLPSSAHTSSASDSNDTNASKPTRTWADVARTPKNSGEDSSATSSKRTTQKGKVAAKTSPTTPKEKEDIRILITVPSTTRLQSPSPYAIRQAICNAIAGLTLENIPKASQTKTGWAITPANTTIRDQLMGNQELRELMIRAIDGDGVTTPQTWYNYAVQHVNSAYRSVNGTEVPITTAMVSDEAYTQTGHRPVSCRTSRHGPNPSGDITWVISFTEPVRTFQLFGTSDRSALIKRRPAITRHNPGCQGYCNPAKCNREPRCSNCAGRITTHDGPHGDNCQHPRQCANCYGPFRAGHDNCAAAPRRDGSTISRLTSRELHAVRKTGQRAYKQHQEQIQQAMVDVQLSQESAATDTDGPPAQRVRGISLTEPATQELSTQVPTTPATGPGNGKQKRKATSGSSRVDPISRPQRLTSFRGNLNEKRLSELSATPRGEHTGSSSQPSNMNTSLDEQSSQ